MRELYKHNGEEDFQVRTAWLYYVEGLTQNAIAEHLGVTRLRVNRAIQDAMHNGIVSINISSGLASCLELEKKLKSQFNLDHVIVTPSPADGIHATKFVGTELGKYLGKILKSNKMKLFGIGWGVTLNHAVRTIRPVKRSGLEIISVLGGLPRGSEFNSFGVSSRLAESLSAQCTYLTLPIYSSSKNSRDIILVQDVFKEVFNKMKNANGIAVGAGDMSRKSLLIKDGLPADVKLNELKKAGAVGDVLGYFLNAEGELLDHPINEELRKRNINVHVEMNIDSYAAIVQLVSHGLGVSVVPEQVRGEDFPPNIRKVPFGIPPIKRLLGIIHQTESSKSNIISVLYNELCELCGFSSNDLL